MRSIILTFFLGISYSFGEANRQHCSGHAHKMAHEALISKEGSTCRALPNSGGVGGLSLRKIIGNEKYHDMFNQICHRGCDAMLFEELSDRCKSDYAEALSSWTVARPIKRYISAKGMFFLGCEYDPKVLKKYVKPLSEEEALSRKEERLRSCFYTSKQVVSPSVASCGNTSACIGSGYCRGNSELRSSTIRVFCEAVDGKCPKIQDCAKADDPTWLKTGDDFYQYRLDEDTIRTNANRESFRNRVRSR